jgi:serine O-acetyltransferase
MAPREDELSPLVEELLESYRESTRTHHVGRRALPSRAECIEILQLLLQVFYPGYFGRTDLAPEDVGYHVGVALSTLREKLSRQIEIAMCWEEERVHLEGREAEAPCHETCRGLALTFLRRLPEVRRTLIADVQAAFEGDPAASSYDEIILAYPGLLAVTVYRVAHELHRLGVPLLPRIMTEWAHTQTGADIHPGATIGPRFFIDHATGVVIGETSHLGADVKLYQGVTLGALSVPRGPGGRVVRGTQRHPTVDDGVTIYANATVLGGETVLGGGSTIGGSVFVTESVPPHSRVAVKPPELRVDRRTVRTAAIPAATSSSAPPASPSTASSPPSASAGPQSGEPREGAA